MIGPLITVVAVVAVPQAAAPVRFHESQLLPVSWVTTDDYPPASLRAEETGRVLYEVTIGTDGVPSDCKVTGSSGFARLDERTCIVGLRARYLPATFDGMPVRARRLATVNWTIPNTLPLPPVPPRLPQPPR